MIKQNPVVDKKTYKKAKKAVNKVKYKLKIDRGQITLENLQIKSLEKAKRLAQALSIIEEECGIHEVRITLKGFFICPWIDKAELRETEMEILLADILGQVEALGKKGEK